jgi:hypothetical protein
MDWLIVIKSLLITHMCEGLQVALWDAAPDQLSS